VIGGKTVKRIDHEWPTTGQNGESTGTQSFTFLLWTAPSGKKIIFEITPGQGATVNAEVERVVASFTPHE